MKAARVPGYLFYIGEDGKYYKPTAEVVIDFNGNEIAPKKENWEEVDYNEEKSREDIYGRMMGKCLIDAIRKLQKEDPEKWAEIEARAEEKRIEREEKERFSKTK